MDPFPHPLPSEPNGFRYSDRAMSVTSSKTVFDTGIKERDLSNGKQCCVVCGWKSLVGLELCHIIPQCDKEKETWKTLKEHRYIPVSAKSAKHEPRNGISMCALHHTLFDNYTFYIRYVSETRQYVFVNHSGNSYLTQFHGKAIFMDADHSHAPFPATFLIHEQRVRGYWPFAKPSPIQSSIPLPQQNWVVSDAQDVSAGGENSSGAGPSYVAMKKEGSGDFDKTICDQPSNTMSFTLDAETIDKILFATRNSESWKACVREGTSWEGTAEENVAKYKDNIVIRETEKP